MDERLREAVSGATNEAGAPETGFVVLKNQS
jgi:hypothetical protein